ncbi:MAG: hypothetical protein Q7S01_01200 [bacterium]|nr:hypothetical protein [bacterium]
MNKKQLRLFVLPGSLLALTLALMMWNGNTFDLFTTNIWYDKIMHLLGGAGACILTLWIASMLTDDTRWKILRFGLPFVGVIGAICFGLGWEGLEDYFPIITDYVIQSSGDTLADLFFDIVGGYISSRYYEEIWRWQL